MEEALNICLRDFLISRGHYDTGALDASISFSIQEDPFEVTLTANHYLLYLDDGMAFEEFTQRADFQELIKQIVEDKLKDLNNGNNN